MTSLAREAASGGGSSIPVIAPGLVTILTVGAAETFAYVAINDDPDTTDATQTIRIAARLPEYFKAIPSVTKVEALAGVTTDLMGSTVGANTTCIRLLYDDVAGEVEIMEGDI
jgi:hypothetical protein